MPGKRSYQQIAEQQRPLATTEDAEGSDDEQDEFSRPDISQQRRRRRILRYLAAFLVVVVVVTVFAALIVAARRRRNMSVAQKVILVLSDGLRWDLYNVSMPNLEHISEAGVKAKSMMPDYPTVSSPNMYTIATGLYVESHGVVDNLAFDPVSKTQSHSFEETLNMTYWWDLPGVEPLWVTARRQGLRTGSIMYPGGNIPIKGVLPDEYIASTPWLWKNIPPRQRVDIAVDWLTEKKMDLVYLYFDEPDEALHWQGIGSTEVNETLGVIDDALGYLLQLLRETHLDKSTNIIVVGDHGHSELLNTTNIFDYVDVNDFDYFLNESGPQVMMKPKEDRFAKVLDDLKGIDHVHAYAKDDIPEHFHYKGSDRVLPLLVTADLGYGFLMERPNKTMVSSHGWDNRHKDMHPLFYAKGPAFKKGFEAETIENVDVYPLMCALLGIKPRANNGSLSRVQDMLQVR